MGLRIDSSLGTYTTEVDDGDETYTVEFDYGRIPTRVRAEEFTAGDDDSLAIDRVHRVCVTATQDVRGIDDVDGEPLDWDGDVAEQLGVDATDYQARKALFGQLYGGGEMPSAADERVSEYYEDILNASQLDDGQKKESETSSDSE